MDATGPVGSAAVARGDPAAFEVTEELFPLDSVVAAEAGPTPEFEGVRSHGLPGPAAGEQPEDLAVLLEDIVGGEPGDPSERLRVEKDKHSGDAVLEWDILAVHSLPQQGEALVLGDRSGIAG
jgi:hypothetical protein